MTFIQPQAMGTTLFLAYGWKPIGCLLGAAPSELIQGPILEESCTELGCVEVLQGCDENTQAELLHKEHKE